MSVKKNFFMSVMVATFQGKPQVRFNTIVGLENGRNVTAQHLDLIQESGAQMMRASNVEFDNLVLDNIFWLGEMTDEEFMANTNLAERISQSQAAQANAEDQRPVQDEIATKLAESMAADPSNVQAEEQAEASAPEPAAEEVTTADVKSED